MKILLATAFALVLAAPAAIAGDGDGVVDGHDFLVWQKGGSPTPAPVSQGDYQVWRSNFGAAGQ